MTPPPDSGAGGTTETEERPLEPPHPRIRARRIEVRRDEGRRRRYRLIGLAVVLVLVMVVVLILRSPLVSVDHVVVTGAHHTPEAEISAASGLEHGQPLIDLNVSRARRRVLALPWVQSASVQRVWPRTVRITVAERQPVAQAKAGDGWAYLDAKGRVLASSPHRAAGLVAISNLVAGAPGTVVGPAARLPLVLAADLPPQLVHAVSSIAIGPTGELTMLMDAGWVTVRIGPPTQLTAKLQALSAVLASAPRTPPIAQIDVLVPSAPVLTRKAGS